jgi:secreted Zn-dependent insulinase-like peptidase
LHLLTPAAYETPAAVVATRLLLRIVEDLLLPDVYVAETAGTHYSLEALQSGVKLAASGFPDVLAELLPRVLGALAGARARRLSAPFTAGAGRGRALLNGWGRVLQRCHVWCVESAQAPT